MPPHSILFIFGCAKNKEYAIFPFNTLIASDQRVCGLQSARI